MGDELLKLFKLPFILFAWFFKTLFLVLIVLFIIILFFASKESILTTIDSSLMSTNSRHGGPIPIQSPSYNHKAVDYILHTVRPGDSLEKIGRIYNVSARTIGQLNNISLKNRLHTGMILYIPQYKDYLSNSVARKTNKNKIIFL